MPPKQHSNAMVDVKEPYDYFCAIPVSVVTARVYLLKMSTEKNFVASNPDMLQRN